jgi:hypothetical protein
MSHSSEGWKSVTKAPTGLSFDEWVLTFLIYRSFWLSPQIHEGSTLMINQALKLPLPIPSFWGLSFSIWLGRSHKYSDHSWDFEKASPCAEQG